MTKQDYLKKKKMFVSTAAHWMSAHAPAPRNSYFPHFNFGLDFGQFQVCPIVRHTSLPAITESYVTRFDHGK